jgi:MFS superfamily sulfate permease-like transporter
MLGRLFTLFCGAVVALSLSTAMFAQDNAKKTKEGRVEGNIVRSSPDKSTLTVRKPGGTAEMIVQYDSSTHWVSQEHGSKKVSDIDANQVKDGDRVIAKGTWEKAGVLHATLISKRLSHSQ